MKKNGTIIGIILGWIFLTLLLGFFYQMQHYTGPNGRNPIFRRRLEVKEPFQVNPFNATGVVEMSELAAPLSPAAADLNNPREAYNLLNGWIPPIEGQPLYPDARRCREVDFQTRLEKTGNYRQLTNNFKRGTPDSCSAPIQDLTLAFYKPEPVPQGGCLGSKEIA